ncbi:DNA-directed RNA polymerase III subunit RPC4 [Morus notabilis]|uniref:DNA-directed RNA polymerase III subunit RPC4 n=1 Tax=Morus notabilis TaxID=981085 RepID=W9R687_9ROSA|nr:DNA-directed RNA polymerase III subunit RPC4 [Morus notabilis]
MDPATLKSEPDAPRKRRFMPKAPPSRVPKAEVKAEVVEETDADQARVLLRRFNEGSTRAKPKVEKKVAAAQVAFGYGGASNTIRSYGVPKGGYRNSQGPPATRMLFTSAAFLSTVNKSFPMHDIKNHVLTDGAFPSGTRQEKEYKEPWDYYSYYPSTLPFRRPHSGNPEFLDEEEFGADTETINYDETSAKAATELGLVEENPETSMILLQLPPIMPLMKRSANTAAGQEATKSSPAPVVAQATHKACALHELPAGFMGKMLVYRSGAIKLKIGDTLYDVSSGMDCVFSQDVVAINTVEKHCCAVGELKKRAAITPDVDFILQSMADL